MDVARDFSTISPSAVWLLAMKSQTEIPFAREAALALLGEEVVARELAESDIPGADMRLHHFEARYRSVDTLLAETGATRILEIGGGLSFRGLALARREPVFYLDTDLPAMAEAKAGLVSALHVGPLAGTLRIAALDALDGDAFGRAVAEIPPGPFAIANEGLLVYFGSDEKARLAAHIRETLLARGGVWITADVYVRSPPDPRIGQDERVRRFVEAHNVEANKFGSWDEAERFFTSCGLAVSRRLSPTADHYRVRESWVLTARR